MRHTSILVLATIGCGGGEGGGIPPRDASPSFVDTALFVPQICTSGLPDDPPTNPNPNCPVNRLPLDDLGVAGSTIRFVARANANSFDVDITFVAGPGGLHVEHPAIEIVDPGTSMPTVAGESTVTLDVAAGQSMALSTLAVVAPASAQWRFRFDAVGPLP